MDIYTWRPPQLYGIEEDCAILYEMNELYRQQSEKEIGDLPVLLWAIAGVFTMLLIHGLVGYAQYRVWLQPIS